jgi:hypothetical protein
MTTLTATQNPIFVGAGETSQRAEIHYDKSSLDELWVMTGVSGWSQVDLLKETKRVEALYKGIRASGSLTPGMSYQVCICEAGHGPLSGQFKSLASLTVFCLLKTPKELPGIGEIKKPEVGGTWCRYFIPTKADTWIIDVGVSRNPVALDGEGLPRLKDNSNGSSTLFAPPVEPPNGPFLAPPVRRTTHDVEIAPLLPGNEYYFSVLVADSSGNWEVKQGKDSPYSFTTLRRQLTVHFSKILVLDDGDWATPGEFDIGFRIKGATPPDPYFRWRHDNIDDWGEKGRPYVLLDDNGGEFKHVGKLEKVQAQENQTWSELMEVSVSSGGKEIDLIEDDYASSELGVGDGLGSRYGARWPLPLPFGRLTESVSNQTFNIDCSGDFHYKVDVIWSTSYGP